MSRGDVVGTDGARQLLRHEQTGDVLRFGGLGAFLTLNVADTRHPLVVLLHAGWLNDVTGAANRVGLSDDGKYEGYSIDLLSGCPDMPKYEEMIRIVAQNPVAQARFFILSMRLFCKHILGTGPFDGHLRHHGKHDNAHPPANVNA